VSGQRVVWIFIAFFFLLLLGGSIFLIGHYTFSIVAGESLPVAVFAFQQQAAPVTMQFDEYTISLTTKLSPASKVSRGCWAIGDIKKNNLLIGEYRGTQSSTKYYYSGTQTFKDGSIEFKVGDNIFEENSCMLYRINIYYRLNADDFNISMKEDGKILYTKEDGKYFLTIDQDVDDFNGKLTVEYEIPTQIGSAKAQLQQDVELKKGLTEIPIIIPTDAATDIIRITPSIELYKKFTSNTNIYSFIDLQLLEEIVKQEQSGYLDPYKPITEIKVGSIQGDTQTYSVHPSEEKTISSLRGELQSLKELFHIPEESSLWPYFGIAFLVIIITMIVFIAVVKKK
jgi:hypothetical protein